MSKYKNLINALLGVTLMTVPEELAELLEKSDDENFDDKEFLKQFKELDKKRVQDLKKIADDNGYKRAEKKIKGDFEDQLKQSLGIESEKQGEELFQEVAEKLKAAPGKGGKTELTDDDVKKHPLYIQLEANAKKAEKAVKDTYEEKIEALKREHSREKVGATVSSKALEIFEGLNPILSTDAAKATNQKKTFVSRFTSMEWEEVNGEFYAMENGKRKEDDHGKAISLSSLVKAEAESLYDFAAAKSRTSPDGKKDDKKDDKKIPYTGKLPKTQAEYDSMMNDRTLPLADRAEINKHWVESQAAGQ